MTAQPISTVLETKSNHPPWHQLLTSQWFQHVSFQVIKSEYMWNWIDVTGIWNIQSCLFCRFFPPCSQLCLLTMIHTSDKYARASNRNERPAQRPEKRRLVKNSQQQPSKRFLISLGSLWQCMWSGSTKGACQCSRLLLPSAHSHHTQKACKWLIRWVLFLLYLNAPWMGLILYGADGPEPCLTISQLWKRYVCMSDSCWMMRYILVVRRFWADGCGVFA